MYFLRLTTCVFALLVTESLIQVNGVNNGKLRILDQDGFGARETIVPTNCPANGNITLKSLEFDACHENNCRLIRGRNFKVAMIFTPMKTIFGMKMLLTATLEGSTKDAPIVFANVADENAFTAVRSYPWDVEGTFPATAIPGTYTLRWSLQSLSGGGPEDLLCLEHSVTLTNAANSGLFVGDLCNPMLSDRVPNMPCNFPHSICDPGEDGLGNECACDLASVEDGQMCRKTISTHCLDASMDLCIDNASCQRMPGGVVDICLCNTGFDFKDRIDFCYPSNFTSTLSPSSTTAAGWRVVAQGGVNVAGVLSTLLLLCFRNFLQYKL